MDDCSGQNHGNTEVWVMKKKSEDNGEWIPIVDQCKPFPLGLVVGGSLAGATILVALGFLAFCIYQVRDIRVAASPSHYLSCRVVVSKKHDHIVLILIA